MPTADCCPLPPYPLTLQHKAFSMKYHTPRKSTLSVSEVVFGCMSLGTDDTANAALIHEAIDAGINCFDTANIYQDGFNEQTLGKALKEKRSKVIIATKVGNQRRADGRGPDWNPRKEHILSEVEESLNRLQTDYIDLYQLHGGTIEDPIDETIEAFETLKQQGKIRFYGISSIRPNVIREYVQRSGIVSVMMQYSLLDRRLKKPVFLYWKKITLVFWPEGAWQADCLRAGTPMLILIMKKTRYTKWLLPCRLFPACNEMHRKRLCNLY